MRFERVEHREDFIKGMQAGCVPLKYAYTGTAAQTHDALAHLATYKELAGRSIVEVQALIGALSERNDLKQFCEVGPGNGLHTLSFVQEAYAHGFSFNRFLGLDISASLLDIFTGRFALQMPGTELTTVVCDLEEGIPHAISAWRSPGPVLLALLGNTIGNLEDPAAALRNLHAVCIEQDILLLGVALKGNQTTEDILRPYQNNVFLEAVFEPFSMLGIEKTECTIDMVYDSDLHCVKGIFTAQREIEIRDTWPTVTIEAGSTIRCFLSRRFTPDALKECATRSGWKVVSEIMDEGANHSVICAVKSNVQVA